MGVQPLGLHHVTAVAGDPQGNVEFYLRALGLRLVKTTATFDAPDTYHLYYGDTAGSPGTIVTFFPWPGAPRGRRGTGQATTVSLAVPPASIGWWTEHLASLGHDVNGASERLDGDVVALTDPTAWCSSSWPPTPRSASPGPAGRCPRSTRSAACTP